MTVMKRVTPEDIIRAAEENGYEWNRGGWFSGSGTSLSPITSACILGQVALNLEVDFSGLFEYLGGLPVNTTVGGRPVTNVGNITDVNDHDFYGIKNYKGMVRTLKRLMSKHMNDEGVLLPRQKLVAIKAKTKAN